MKKKGPESLTTVRKDRDALFTEADMARRRISELEARHERVEKVIDEVRRLAEADADHKQAGVQTKFLSIGRLLAAFKRL